MRVERVVVDVNANWGKVEVGVERELEKSSCTVRHPPAMTLSGLKVALE
jgi:hypothetical protein